MEGSIKSNKSNYARWLLTPVRFLLFTVILVGCTIRGQDKNSMAEEPVVPGISVDGRIVKATKFSEELEVAGSLVAYQEVEIVSELTRKIVDVPVREGNFVRAGTLLFQLDDEDLQAQLEQLRQREKLAMLNEARLEDLIEHDAAVQQDYDQAATNLKVLQAEIRQLLVTIDKTHIRAPFNGRIGIINTYKGALVSPDRVLTKIVDDAQVKVEFSVPEKYASMIPIGSKQHFTVESDIKEYEAKVIASESRIDETTRTLLVRAISPNPGRRLIPGQSARIRITVLTDENALMVSSQALIPSSQGYSLFVADNNEAKMIPVVIGQRDPYDVQILKGVSAGDTVITSNLLRLTPGTRVEFATIN